MKGTKKGVVFRKRQKTKVEEEEDRESQMVLAFFPLIMECLDFVRWPVYKMSSWTFANLIKPPLTKTSAINTRIEISILHQF